MAQNGNRSERPGHGCFGNFLTETGAQGIFQEALEPQLPGDFPEQSDTEKIHAYFPDDARRKKNQHVQNYMDSLSQIFPEFKKAFAKDRSYKRSGLGRAMEKIFQTYKGKR